MDPRNSGPHILCLSKPQFVSNDTYPRPDQIYLLSQKRTTLFYSHWIIVKHPLCVSFPLMLLFRTYLQFVDFEMIWMVPRILVTDISEDDRAGISNWSECVRMRNAIWQLIIFYLHFWPPNMPGFYHQFETNYQNKVICSLQFSEQSRVLSINIWRSGTRWTSVIIET